MTESDADFSKRARAVCDAATEGPWNVWEALDDYHVFDSSNEPIACWTYAYVEGPISLNKQDAAFIALARTALPEALDRLEKAEAECKWLREEVKRLDALVEDGHDR